MSGDRGDQLDRVCAALSDTTRRRLLQRLARSPGLTTGELTATAPRVTRWAVMKHIAVLRDAGLVQSLPEGRRRRHYRDERGLDALREWLGGPTPGP